MTQAKPATKAVIVWLHMTRPFREDPAEKILFACPLAGLWKSRPGSHVMHREYLPPGSVLWTSSPEEYLLFAIDLGAKPFASLPKVSHFFAPLSRQQFRETSCSCRVRGISRDLVNLPYP